MQQFKETFTKTNPSSLLFSNTDIGQESYWWDYGQVSSYYKNSLLLTKDCEEAQAMRIFYDMDQFKKKFCYRESAELFKSRMLEGEIDIDDNSILIGSDITAGKIRNSIIVGVNAQHLDVCDAVIINTSAHKIQGKQFLCYNAFEKGEMQFNPLDVRADAFQEPKPEHLKFFTSCGNNGSADWEKILEKNPMSYDKLYAQNKKTGLKKFLELQYRNAQLLASPSTNAS